MARPKGVFSTAWFENQEELFYITLGELKRSEEAFVVSRERNEGRSEDKGL